MRVPITLLGMALAAGALSLAATVVPRAGSISATSPVIEAGDFEIDPVHSSVHFRIKHLGVSYAYGRFNELSGKIHMAEDATQSSVEVMIAAESVDTNSDGRDKHIRSPDFLNAKQFPAVTFKSTKVEAKDGDVFAVTGELEMHGVKKEVTIDMQLVGSADTGRMGYRAGFEGKLEIMRRDFGIGEGMSDDALSNEITLALAIEATKS